MEPCRELVIAGRYRLHEEIGRGGVGTVWRAQSVALDIPCAIKFLLPQHAQDPSQRARFIHEARAAAALRSPHSVVVFDVDEWEGLPFIAMELLTGQSLEQCLQVRGRLSPEFTCEVVRQIALGLGKAHAAGLVHRDLKPDNVFLVDEEGPLLVKILDFGIAKRTQAVHDFRTVTGALIGTPYYMSPEQAKGSKEVDFRSDLWSLAVLTYRCLTGRLPFGGDNLPEILMKIVHNPLPSLSDAEPTLPKAVEAWWQGAADRDPSARASSAVELSKNLQRALFGANGVPGPIPEYMLSGTRMRPELPSPATQPARGRTGGRRRVLWAALAAAALVLLVSAYLWQTSAAPASPVQAGTEHRVTPSVPKPPPAAVAAPAAVVAAPVLGEAPQPGREAVASPVPPVSAAAVPEGAPAAPDEARRSAGPGAGTQAPATRGESGRPPVNTASKAPAIESNAARKPVAAAPAALRKPVASPPPPPAAPPPAEPKKPKSGLDERLGF